MSEPEEDPQHARAVLEQLPIIVWTTDRELRITGSLGLRSGETPGPSLHDLLQTRDESSPAIAAHAAALAGSASTCELDWRGRPYLATVQPLRDAGGAVIGTIGAALDAGHLRQSQRAEAIGHLAGGVAHDFNNLLTVIIGSCEILATTPLDKIGRKFVDEIRLAADQGAALSQRLLAFTRRQPVEARPTDLSAVVRGMDRVLRRLLGDDIDLVATLDMRAGRVRADPSQIEQVVLNAAANARDAMPKGGRLTVKTSRTETDGKREVLLTLADTGCGMDEATLARVFEPFFTTKPGAQGLGLKIVKGTVRELHGRVELASKPGEGTTVGVRLPWFDDPPAAAFPAGGGTETILLVDDQASVRMTAREALKMRGYTVLEARDGPEAQRMSERYRGQIHLVVADVVMPGMSGPQLGEAIKPHRPQARFLYMSGHADTAQHGTLSPFLPKPFTQETLAAKVREVLDGERSERKDGR